MAWIFRSQTEPRENAFCWLSGLAGRGKSREATFSTGLALLKTQSFATVHGFYHGLLVGLLVVTGGCHDPRFVSQNEIRRRRTEHHVKQYVDHDAAGPERIQKTLDIHEKLRKGHEESLKKTCALCRRMHERDVERWRSERDRRREWIKTYLHGKPEQIDDTWAKMIY